MSWRRVVPGFRTGTLWKQVVAVGAYAVVLFFLLIGATARSLLVALVGVLLLAAWLLAADTGGVRRRLPLFGSSNVGLAALAWVGYGVAAFALLVAATPRPADGGASSPAPGGSGPIAAAGAPTATIPPATAGAVPTAPPASATTSTPGVSATVSVSPVAGAPATVTAIPPASPTSAPPTPTSPPPTATSPPPTATSPPPTATPVPVSPTAVPTATRPPSTATPDPVPALVQQVDAAWAAADWPRVITALERLRTLTPNDPAYTEKLYAAHVAQGQALLTKGDRAGAGRAFAAADRVDSSRGEAKAHLAALTPTLTPVPGVGAPVLTGDVAVLVGEVRFLPRIGYSEPDPGNEFVVLGVGLKNVSKTRVGFNQYSFRLQDGGGVLRRPPIVLGLDNGLGAGELAPDGTVTGWVPFEIRQGDRDLTVVYKGCFLLCDEARIRVG